MDKSEVAILCDALHRMTEEVRFTWWYTTGKTGYECPYCGAIERYQSDIHKTDNHHRQCAWASATRLLNKRESVAA